jgi:hypothetical protein
MRLTRRAGFVASPRTAFPVLIVIVALMFLLFASLDTQGVSPARIFGTALVGALILLLLGTLALLSRGKKPAPND